MSTQHQAEIGDFHRSAQTTETHSQEPTETRWKYEYKNGNYPQ